MDAIWVLNGFEAKYQKLKYRLINAKTNLPDILSDPRVLFVSLWYYISAAGT